MSPTMIGIRVEVGNVKSVVLGKYGETYYLALVCFVWDQEVQFSCSLVYTWDMATWLRNGRCFVAAHGLHN